MNKLLACILLLGFYNAVAQHGGSIVVNGSRFTVQSYFPQDADSVESSAEQGPDSIQLYRHDKKLLSHILKQVLNDCNSSSLEFGDWEIRDSSIVFYSYYSFNGKCVHCPFGVKKQVYAVSNKGVVSLKEALVSIAWALNEKRFLTDAEARSIPELVLAYEGNAKVLKGKEAMALRKEVKSKLDKKIKAVSKEEGISYKELH